MPTKKARKSAVFMLMVCLLCLLFGCADDTPQQSAFCTVVLQDGAHFTTSNPVQTVAIGESVQFQLAMEAGYQVDVISYPDCSVQQLGQKVLITLNHVFYTESVQITTKPAGIAMLYHANGGTRLDGGDAAQPVQEAAAVSHLRQNTSLGRNLFARSGYVQTGWNTKPDGSGTRVGLGSRIAYTQGTVLYAQWSKCTPTDRFSYKQQDGTITITGYMGDATVVTIPESILGLPVVALGEGALQNASCKTLVLPASVTVLEAGCCQNSALQEVYLYDSITAISDASFSGCKSLTLLYINAAQAPVYSGNYFDTFQDKLDRLMNLAQQEKQKMVLFSGSSTRFGFDCDAMQQALPQFSIVNMGVFAYTNALPQLEIILAHLKPGDVLLHAPEFDASPYQFCSTNKLDAAFFCMMESNYDAVTLLDLRNYSQVFSAFNTYLYQKRSMQGKSYAMCAADYDEAGVYTPISSYNQYGDYVLYRPNAETNAPVYGYPASYTTAAFEYSRYIAPMNNVYDRCLQAGVTVYFTYAPRNIQALSSDSTPEMRAELHEYLCQNLRVPVISNLEESLYAGKYLYGTDNHLSTEGVAIRTQRVLTDLAAQTSLPQSEVRHG